MLALHGRYPGTASTSTRATRRRRTWPRCAARALPGAPPQLRAGAQAWPRPPVSVGTCIRDAIARRNHGHPPVRLRAAPRRPADAVPSRGRQRGCHAPPCPYPCRLVRSPCHARAAHRRRQVGDRSTDRAARSARSTTCCTSSMPDAPHIDADAVATIARWLGGLDEPRRNPAAGAIGSAERTARDARRPRLELGSGANAAHRPLAGLHRLPRRPHPRQHAGATACSTTRCWWNWRGRSWPMKSRTIATSAVSAPRRAQRGRRWTRQRWLRARIEEGALWEHLHHVHEHPYVDGGDPERELRVLSITGCRPSPKVTTT